MSVWIDIFHVPFRPRRLPERYISKIRSTRDRLQCMYAYGQTMRYESAEVRTKNEKFVSWALTRKQYINYFLLRKIQQRSVCVGPFLSSADSVQFSEQYFFRLVFSVRMSCGVCARARMCPSLCNVQCRECGSFQHSDCM